MKEYGTTRKFAGVDELPTVENGGVEPERVPATTAPVSIDINLNIERIAAIAAAAACAVVDKRLPAALAPPKPSPKQSSAKRQARSSDLPRFPISLLKMMNLPN